MLPVKRYYLYVALCCVDKYCCSWFRSYVVLVVLFWVAGVLLWFLCWFTNSCIAFTNNCVVLWIIVLISSCLTFLQLFFIVLCSSLLFCCFFAYNCAVLRVIVLILSCLTLLQLFFIILCSSLLFCCIFTYNCVAFTINWVVLLLSYSPTIAFHNFVFQLVVLLLFFLLPLCFLDLHFSPITTLPFFLLSPSYSLPLHPPEPSCSTVTLCHFVLGLCWKGVLIRSPVLLHDVVLLVRSWLCSCAVPLVC